MMTGWKYDLIDRQGARTQGRIVGDNLETEAKVRIYLRHTYGEDGNTCPLECSSYDDDDGGDTPDWRREEIDDELPAFLRKQAD